MQELPAEIQKLEGLAGEGELLLLCHPGVRSLQATQWLREQGLKNCYSVTGGIDRWSVRSSGRHSDTISRTIRSGRSQRSLNLLSAIARQTSHVSFGVSAVAVPIGIAATTKR